LLSDFVSIINFKVKENKSSAFLKLKTYSCSLGKSGSSLITNNTSNELFYEKNVLKDHHFKNNFIEGSSKNQHKIKKSMKKQSLKYEKKHFMTESSLENNDKTHIKKNEPL